MSRQIPGSTAALAVALQTSDLKGAIEELKEAIRLQPSAPWLHSQLAELLLKANDLDGAIAEYREGLRLDSSLSGARAALNLALKLKADRDKQEGRIAPSPREAKRP